MPKPHTYEESLADKLKEGKHIYVDPQYLPPGPPEYNWNEGSDYALDEEEDLREKTNEILKDLEITDYENVDKILNQPEMTPQKTRSYINKIIATANFRRNQLKGYKAPVTHAYKKGEIGEAERA